MKKSISQLIALFVLLISSQTSFAQLENDTVTTNVNTSIIIDVRANDPIQNTCIYTTDYSLCCGSNYATQNGTIEILDWDSIRYTPNNDFVGNDQFHYSTYTQQNSTGACDTAVVYVQVMYPTGISNTVSENGFVIQPNPIQNDMLSLKGITLNSSNYQLKIHDVLGRVVQLDILEVATDVTFYSIPLMDLENGIYFLELVDNEKRFVEQFIVK